MLWLSFDRRFGSVWAGVVAQFGQVLWLSLGRCCGSVSTGLNFNRRHVSVLTWLLFVFDKCFGSVLTGVVAQF